MFWNPQTQAQHSDPYLMKKLRQPKTMGIFNQVPSLKSIYSKFDSGLTLDNF